MAPVLAGAVPLAAWQAGLVTARRSQLRTALPPAVRTVVAGRVARLAWENEVGGLTYEVGAGPDRCFVKWTPAASGIDLGKEAARLAWAAPFIAVPRLLSHGRDDAGSWIVTAALPGQNAASTRWKAEPRTAVTAIGEGLRAMHDALPVAACPFSWTAEDRLAEIRGRAGEGRIDPASWDDVHQPLGISRALELLADIPAADQLVVCHGDSCAPNTLLTGDGCWSGHVDLGELGIADRWADLAVATWSTEWNYGPGWDGLLLDAYGVPPDTDRTKYYRLLWDLGP
ncbi:MAG: kanamycin kinase [Streptosporangiaceae bacterium]|nr:kanamycin kinase [Streptosporangiaceae bacterium]